MTIGPVLPPHPAADECISASAAKAFCRNDASAAGESQAHLGYYYLVDQVANALAGVHGNMLAIARARRPAADATHDVVVGGGLSLLKPELRSYGGMEEAEIAKLRLHHLLQKVGKIASSDSEQHPVTKVFAHRCMDIAYNMIDSDPANAQAADCRKKLQDGAKALGLEELGKSAAGTRRWLQRPSSRTP